MTPNSAVAVLDELVVDRPRALGERLDDLDRVNLVGQVREIGGLVAGAGADLQHPLPDLGIDVRRHPADDVGARNRDPEADVEEGVLIGAAEILLQHELLARRQKKRVLVPIVDEVFVAHHRAEAVESLAQVFGILAALRHAPGDELLATVRRRRHVEGESRRNVSHRQPRRERARNQAGGAGDKLTSMHQRPPQTAFAGSIPVGLIS